MDEAQKNHPEGRALAAAIGPLLVVIRHNYLQGRYGHEALPSSANAY
jgi:hypothetical protein